MVGFTIETHDCSHKFLDDTKTCVQLFLTDHFGIKTSIVYIFTSDTEEQIMNKKDEYLTLLLNHIKENTNWK